MAERLERLLCNQTEEMWISLRTEEGDPQVELRMYGCTASAGAEPVRAAEAVAIPASLLPTLVRALSHVEKTLISRGVIYVPPSPKITQWSGEQPHPRHGGTGWDRLLASIRGDPQRPGGVPPPGCRISGRACP
jgi:hypothetical protein